MMIFGSVMVHWPGRRHLSSTGVVEMLLHVVLLLARRWRTNPPTCIYNRLIDRAREIAIHKLHFLLGILVVRGWRTKQPTCFSTFFYYFCYFCCFFHCFHYFYYWFRSVSLCRSLYATVCPSSLLGSESGMQNSSTRQRRIQTTSGLCCLVEHDNLFFGKTTTAQRR